MPTIRLTEREVTLISNLVNHHIRSHESLIEHEPRELPKHKHWLYDLEDKIDEINNN